MKYLYELLTDEDFKKIVEIEGLKNLNAGQKYFLRSKFFNFNKLKNILTKKSLNSLVNYFKKEREVMFYA